MLAPLTLAAALFAAPPDAGRLAPLIPPTAWAAGHFDLTRLGEEDFAAVEALLGLPTDPDRPLRAPDSTPFDEQRKIVAAAKAAGITEAVVVIDPTAAGGGGPVSLWLPADAAAAGRFTDRVTAAGGVPGERLRFLTRGDLTAVRIGDGPVAADSGEPEDRPLAAAWAAADDAPVRISYAPTNPQRRALRFLLPAGGPVDGATLAKLEWLTLALTPRGEAVLKMEAKAADADAAQALAAAPRALAKLAPQAPDLPAEFTPQTDGDRLSLALDRAQFRAALELSGAAEARAAANRAQAMNDFKQVGLAMHNFHASYKSFPPRASFDGDKPLLSWRVHVLPFLDANDLYKRFRLNEPWDSEHNKALLAEMPDVFASPGETLPPGHTRVQVPAGEGLIFEGKAGRRLQDVTDGTTGTILAVEAETAVPWTKPADWTPDLTEDGNPLAGLYFRPGSLGVTLVGFVDGSVRALHEDVDPTVARGLLTVASGEVVDALP